MATSIQTYAHPAVGRALALAHLDAQAQYRASDAWAELCVMQWDYRVEAAKAQQPRTTPTYYERRQAPRRPRKAWDTDALRQRACTVHKVLAAFADADPDSPDKAERAKADMIPPAAMLRSWRMERLARRYPEIRVALDKLNGQAILPAFTHYQGKDGREYKPALDRSEARKERKARKAKAIGPNADPVYGRLSRQAEREAEAEHKLRGFRVKGHFASGHAGGRAVQGQAFVKVQRYPRLRAIRAWVKYLAGVKAGDMHLLCYGSPRAIKREIVTAADRERRHAKRVRKAVTRVAAQVGQTAEGIAALEAILMAAKARIA